MTFQVSRWSTVARNEEEFAEASMVRAGYETESAAIDGLYAMIRDEITRLQCADEPNEMCIARLYAMLWEVKYAGNTFECGVRVEVGGLAFGVYGRDTRGECDKCVD